VSHGTQRIQKTGTKFTQGYRGKAFVVSEYKLVEMLNVTLNRLKFRGLDYMDYEILPLTKVKGVRTYGYDMQLSCLSSLVLGYW